MKNLLLFVNSYSAKMETFIYNNIKDLADTGLFNITILCHSLPDPDFNIKADIEVICLNIEKSWLSRLSIIKELKNKKIPFFRLLKYGRNAFNFSLFYLAEKLNNRQFDVIHAHFGQNGQLLAQLKDAGLLNSKIVTQFHGIDFTGKKYTKKYYTELAKHAAVIIAVTEFSKRKLLILGFSNDKIEVLPVGSDPEPLKNTGLEISRDNSVFKIIFVGRLIELKGVSLLPEIANKLVKSGIENFKIVVVGDGPLKPVLERADLLNKSTLEIMGFKTSNVVKELMCSANVLLYPGIVDQEGRQENQCVTVQEAMFMELPVVASALGGLPETVIDGETGYLVEPGNVDEIENRLIQLYKDKALRLSMGVKARQFALSKYNINSIHEQLILFY